jgi:hypothetical protein
MLLLLFYFLTKLGEDQYQADKLSRAIYVINHSIKPYRSKHSNESNSVLV